VDLLAHVYRKQERYSEAMKLFKRVVQAMEKRYGQDHVDTARALGNLGSVYYLHRKDANKAEATYRKDWTS
jgi:hypothetical protein